MKKHVCLNCESADMRHGVKNITIRFHDLSRVVPKVEGWHCPKCGETEFTGKGAAVRAAAALDALKAQWQGKQRGELLRIRKRLGLTQRQAAALTGGGHNAFSRYERGEAQPLPAVLNLFRLLDKHPELLKELKAA